MKDVTSIFVYSHGDVITVFHPASWQQQVLVQPPRSLYSQCKQERDMLLIRAFCPNRKQLSTFSAQDRWGKTADRQCKRSEHTPTKIPAGNTAGITSASHEINSLLLGESWMAVLSGKRST